MEEDEKLGFYGGTLGIAWSESNTDSVQDYNGNVYDIARHEEGDETVFESYFNGSLETVTKSKDDFGVTSFEEK